MRVFLMTAGMVALTAMPSAAQNAPLYNTQNKGSPTTLYNSGGAARPLSLNQIIQGRSDTGYSYSRQGTGYQPYGTASDGYASGLYPTQAQMDAFRSQRAAEAQAAERASMASLQNIHANNAPPPVTSVPALPSAVGATGAPVVGQQPQQAVRPRQRYQGRDTGVTEPAKVFNSVR